MDEYINLIESIAKQVKVVGGRMEVVMSVKIRII